MALWVPMTPMRPLRLARAAARAPGSTTPSTGTGKASRSAGSATAEAVLQATTSISMPWPARKRALFSEYWVVSG